jgi:peptidyl-prolyl cis-trans isomerase A (cyclophilin A)
MKRALFALLGSALLLASCGGAKKSTRMEAAPAQYKVRMQTSKGEVVVLVHRDWSPLGADHFFELTKLHFYDGNRFFRCIPGFVVQWGLNGDPDKNKTWREIAIRDDPPKVSNKAGTVVFASAGPNSRTTQVFINLGDNSAALDSQGFTPFGEVILGMNNIAGLFMGYGDSPPNGAGPDQAAISDIGNDYLDHHFPKLDYIKTARIAQ